MKTLAIDDLELQVDHLLQTIDQLKSENSSLRRQIKHHIHECSRLETQKKQTTATIREIVSQLRDGL